MARIGEPIREYEIPEPQPTLAPPEELESEPFEDAPSREVEKEKEEVGVE